MKTFLLLFWILSTLVTVTSTTVYGQCGAGCENIDRDFLITNFAAWPQGSDCNQDGSGNVLELICMVGTVPDFDYPQLVLPTADPIQVGSTMVLQLEASDPNGDPLHFSVTPLPEGAALDGATGVFSYTPKSGQEGITPLRFLVSDGFLRTAQWLQVEVLSLTTIQDTSPAPG